MNIEKTRKAVDVMLAYVNGAEIECQIGAKSEWSAIPSPAWQWANGPYRIKPKPREFWANPIKLTLYPPVECRPIGCIKVREVL